MHQFLGTIDSVDTWIANALALSDAHGFRQWHAGASVLKAWLLATRHKSPEYDALDQLREGIARWRTCGANSISPYFDCLLGDALFRHDRGEEGLRVLAGAQVLIDATEDRQHEAELFRIRGEILLKQLGDGSEAEMCFRRSLAIARSQRAKSWELRAAMSLARLWRGQGKAAGGP